MIEDILFIFIFSLTICIAILFGLIKGQERRIDELEQKVKENEYESNRRIK